MKRGSSQPTGKKFSGFVVASSKPPVVEIDTEATAAYVRFGSGKVAKTMPFGASDALVMVDFDIKGRVVGIEVVGQREFSIGTLLRGSPVKLTQSLMNRTRYVSADLVAA